MRVGGGPWSGGLGDVLGGVPVMWLVCYSLRGSVVRPWDPASPHCERAFLGS